MTDAIWRTLYTVLLGVLLITIGSVLWVGAKAETFIRSRVAAVKRCAGAIGVERSRS